MRVVLLIGDLDRGGAEKQLMLLADSLGRLGHEVLVLAVHGGPREVEFRQRGIEYRTMRPTGPPRARPRPPGGSLLAARFRAVPGRVAKLVDWSVRPAWWLFRELRTVRPDVLHAFLPRTNLLACVVGRWARVPVVVVGRRSLGHYWADHRLLDRGERVLTRRASCVVTNSVAIADQVVERSEIEPSRVHVIANAIEPSWLVGQPERAGRPVCWRFVTVSNHREVKDLFTLVEALDRVHAAGLEFVWSLVGDGFLRPALDEAASTRPWMRLLGALDETDVRAELDASDVYLGSSRTEGMSNSIMEAISRHLPTIATDVGGTHELVGTAGVLVEAGRPDLLAAEIVRVTGDAELVERLRAASALRATGFRTPNDTALEHVRLYQRYERH